jgi:hypothetical protein
MEDSRRKSAVLEQAKEVFESAMAADLQDLDRTGLKERYHTLVEAAAEGGCPRSARGASRAPLRV